MVSIRCKMKGMWNKPGSLSTQPLQELELMEDPIKDPIQIK